MNCPKCRALLTLNETEGHIGFNCANCHGLWLPGKFVASHHHGYDFNVESFRKSLAENRLSTTTGHCPSCDHQLIVSLVKEIELDWCDRCGGVWFDKTELTRLVTFQHQLTSGQKVV